MRDKEREFTPEVKYEIKKETHFRCALCGSSYHLTIHHCIPMSMGGSGEKTNGVAVCPPCHQLLDYEATVHH